jgi:hypothetical protein
MIDYNILEAIVIIALMLLIMDCGLGIFMKLRLLHKCSVICEEDSD